jgi:Mn2+/Fe2+ NRAMP family transporter
LSAVLFLFVGNPVKVLVWAGTINGFILPLGLTIILLASRKKNVVGKYRHPLWLQIAGWFVVAVMAYFSVKTLIP